VTRELAYSLSFGIPSHKRAGAFEEPGRIRLMVGMGVAESPFVVDAVVSSMARPVCLCRGS
jgi:hypothetical protein